jgi:hypothetical protein
MRGTVDGEIGGVDGLWPRNMGGRDLRRQKVEKKSCGDFCGKFEISVVKDMVDVCR